MTQHDVARAVGMPQPSIARIEAGAVLPRTATLLAILEATGHELLVEPRLAVRPEVRQAARERLSRSIPRRTRDALGGAGATSLLRPLRAAGVRFVLIGDLAEVVHGARRTLGREVEICPDPGPQTAERLATVQGEMGPSLVVTPVTAAGDDYETLVRNASRLIIDTSLLVRVAALEDLMRVRRARGERADLEILAALEQTAVRRAGAGPGRRAAEG